MSRSPADSRPDHAAARERIKEITQRLTILRGEIEALEAEEHPLLQDLAGVRAGDIVTVTQRGRDPFDVLVDRVDTRWAKPWIHGFKRKKNGEWGSQSHAYYSDWEKVESDV